MEDNLTGLRKDGSAAASSVADISAATDLRRRLPYTTVRAIPMMWWWRLNVRVSPTGHGQPLCLPGRPTWARGTQHSRLRVVICPLMKMKAGFLDPI